MILFLLSLLITLLTAYQINRFLKYDRFFDWLLGYFLINFSLVVIVLTFAGLIRKMNDQWIVLLIQLLLMGVCWLVSWRMQNYANPMPKPEDPVTVVKGVPIYILLFAGAMTFAVLLHLVFVLFVPPNNNDALMWHFSRVAMWHQTGSWLPWNTPVTWQLTFPFNGEMISYWTLLFLKRDALIAALPLISGIFSALIIYHLSEQLFHKKELSIFVAGLWLSFPIVQINLSSGRHDHPGTFLLMSAFYFLYHGLIHKRKSNWILVGLSLALAVGTNMGVATYLPGFAVVFMVSWLLLKKMTFKDVLVLGISTIILFLLITSPIYISNQIHFQSVLGPGASEMTSQGGTDDPNMIEHFLLMNGRWAYQLFDCRGFPERFSDKCHRVKTEIATQISAASGLSLEVEKSLFNQYIFSYDEFLPITEDSAWYSLSGMAVSIVVGLYAMVSAIKQKEFFFVALASFVVVVPVTMAVLWSGWKPWDGRYYLFLVALYCVGFVPLLIQIKPKIRNGLVILLLLLAIVNMAFTLIGNPGRTILGESAFWKKSRSENLSIQAGILKAPLYLVDEYVPEDAVLAMGDYSTSFRYEYGYFGERFTRTVVLINPLEYVCNADWLQSNQVEYILLGITEGMVSPCTPKGYSYLESYERWLLFIKD